MLRKLLFVCFFVVSFSQAQFNESAPWMDGLEKTNSASAKTSNQPLSLYTISEAFHQYWEGRDHTKKGSGFKPYMRWENFWSYQVDENGFLPSPKDLWTTWKNKQSSTLKNNPTSRWTSLGPFSAGSFPGRLPGQGRVNAVAVDPNDENTWYVGAPAGGIWKSTDAGASWVNLFDNFLQIGVSGIAIDPNDSDIIYIATGDDDAGDSFGIGVFKSTDGGASWNETGLNPGNSTVNTRMNEIVVDPTNSNIIWVGTTSGLRKSVNGGDSFTSVRSGNIRDFKLKPGDPNTVYAVSTSGYFKTEDGGDTFPQITDILPAQSGRLVLGVSPADPEVVYVLSANTGANDFSYQGLFKSTDGGDTFTETSNTVDIFESDQAWFDLALEVAPDNANELYIGCLNIYRSSNGGNTFTRLNQWFRNDAAYSHADIHTLKFFNDKLFCGSDGGIYVSENNGASFTDYTVNGIAISQFYRLSIANGDASKIIGGLQDNGGHVLNNGSWNNYHGGDGMDNVIDPNNPDLLYGFTQFGGSLNISSDSGGSVGSVGPPRDDAGNTIRGNWITPLTISTTGEVYSGFDAVYKLVGSAWEKISGDIGTGNIDDLEADPNDPMVLYAAEADFVFKSDDGGVTFTALNRFDSEISDIAISNSDPNVLYVTTSRRVGISQANQPSSRGVYKLTINGANAVEEDITFNLPTDQAFFAIAHQGRHTDNPIYVGTNLGVYRLDDTLTEWEEYFTDLPSTAVGDIEISLEDEKIIAATYGRGVWESPIPVQVPNDDISLLSLSPAVNSVFCGEIIPSIEVENKGINPITSVDVTFNINGGADQNFTSTGTIAAGATTTIDLPSLNISTIGATDLAVTVTVANDTFADNNSLTNTFFVNEFGLGDAINTFETADDALVTYNEGTTGSVWERGQPTGTVLNQASSGTQVYATNLDGNHPDGTIGILLSNCYELSSILAPVLKFQMAYELEQNFDIVYVQYSTDDGLNWNLLGNINSQPNWYSSDRTNASSGNTDCENCPGGQWTGTNATLTEYAYDFEANAANGETDLTNEPNVLFRIVFQSDPNVNEEGVVIDDFVVEGFQDDDDDDNDGVLDVDDNCPLIGNANQLDTNNDGEGDVCDDDDDGDGILDVNDNCPLTPNTNQADSDNDGIGDVCDMDADNDGVPNDLDTCPNTPANAVVDVSGCEVFTLPASNFRIQTTGESCISSNNGSVEITATTNLDYTATLTGNGATVDNTFTTNTSFTDLMSGTYSLCITVAGQAGYESCSDIVISQPDPLSVSSKINSLNNEVTLKLGGAKSYSITINGVVYATSESEITLPLTEVENTLSVKTDLDCQGVYEETIILSSEMFIYPNPVASGDLILNLGNSDFEEVRLSLYSIKGTRVFSKPFQPEGNNTVRFNVDLLPSGVYLLNVKTDKSLVNYKIIRK